MTTLEVAKQIVYGSPTETLSGWGWYIYPDGSLSNYRELSGDKESIGKIDELKLSDAVSSGYTEEDYSKPKEDKLQDYYNVLESWVDEAIEGEK